jgi:hypothetical protein
MFNTLNHKGNVTQTTMKFYFTPVRVASIKKQTTNAGKHAWGRKGNVTHCW